MNHVAVYSNLIDKARCRQEPVKGERHHVIPKCIGGSNDETNLVKLTYREHFLAHKLLAYIHPESVPMAKAVVIMAGKQKLKSRGYEWIRQLVIQDTIKRLTGVPRPPHIQAMLREIVSRPKSEAHRRNLSLVRTGTKSSEETKKKVSAAMKGRIVSEETRRKLSQAKAGRPIPKCRGNKSKTGQRNSDSTRIKISEANSGKKHSKEWCQNISKGQAEWSDDAIRAIRAKFDQGHVTKAGLARDFQCSESHIRRVVTRKGYYWVDECP